MQLPKEGSFRNDDRTSEGSSRGRGGPGGGAQEGPSKNRRKSGRKSRFLQKAKKFGKQGKLGRGYELDNETYEYFIRVLEIWKKNEFENDEERESFVTNSLSQTTGNEVNYSSNQMTSRVLETILPVAGEDVLLRFCGVFSETLRTLCADPYASHVIEKLLEITSSDKWAKTSPKLTEWFRQTSRYVLNNLEEFTFDPYANHVMRKVCQCLCGVVEESGQAVIQQEHLPPQKKTKGPTRPGSELFGERIKNRKNEEIFADFYQRFLAWPQFYDLFGSELTSGLVQVVLKTCARVEPEVLSATASLEDGISKTLEAVGVLDLANTTQANLHTRILEVCLSISTKSWQKIYANFFEGKLVAFGVNEKGKFSLKKVIEMCPSKEEFETIFDELNPGLQELNKAKSTSPFVSLSLGCRTFQTRQSQFLKSLLEVMGHDEGSDQTSSKDNLIMKLAGFGGKLELKEDGTPKYLTQFVGTMLLQNILDFQKPKQVITSFLELSSADLIKLTTDPKGSHVTESFFTSSTIGEKNKEKLLNKMKGDMVALAMNKFGSRVIDSMWAWASLRNRGIIAASLSDRLSQLNANQYGKFLSSKCGLHVYKRDPKLWGEAIQKAEKKEKSALDVFAEFLEDPEPEESTSGEKKKHKKKSKHEREEMVAEESQKTEPEAEEEVPRKHKKKKRRSEEEQAEMEMEVVEASGKRKKKHEAVEEQPEEETLGKRKKKRKGEAEPVQEAVEVTTTQAVEEVNDDDDDGAKKKKKKHKRQHPEASEESQPDSTTAEPEPEEEPKRKKKKKKTKNTGDSE